MLNRLLYPLPFCRFSAGSSVSISSAGLCLELVIQMHNFYYQCSAFVAFLPILYNAAPVWSPDLLPSPWFVSPRTICSPFARINPNQILYTGYLKTQIHQYQIRKILQTNNDKKYPEWFVGTRTKARKE